MNKKSEAFAVAIDASAVAAAARAAQQYADRQPGTPAKKSTVQCNFRISADCRERLRNYAFANGMTERDLIEWFCGQLPAVEVPKVAALQSVGFVK